MNHMNQLRNLIEFTALFLSGDLSLINEDPSYIKEKFDKYIGFPTKNNSEKSILYLEWSKIWGENEDINSMFLYFVEIFNIYRQKDLKRELELGKHWLTYITADELLDTFEKYIGKTDHITTKRYSHIHPLVTLRVIDEFVSKNIRLFKLLRILEK